MSEIIERVAQRLRAECQDVFGSSWNNDIAARFARASIDAIREPTPEMASDGRYAINAEPDTFADSNEAATACWIAMIDAALTPSLEKA